MYRKLLAARFKLIFHREKRELSVYAIRVVNNGPKLTKSLGDPNGQPDSTRVPAAAQRAMRYTNSSMGDFAFSIQGFLDRPVVDQTGLPGKFDFLLKWTNDESRVGGPNEAPGIFTAIQEQLGLKLEPAKALADIFVIDHVERPSEN